MPLPAGTRVCGCASGRKEVNLVLGGDGRVQVLLDGRPVRTVAVHGSRLYTLLRLPRVRNGLLELRVDRGVAGYAFTFG